MQLKVIITHLITFSSVLFQNETTTPPERNLNRYTERPKINPLEEDLLKTNVSSFDEIHKIIEYNGPSGVEVHQAEAIFLAPQGDISGLYTTGAVPCSIVIGISKGRELGNITRIGMTHIDRGISSQSIIDFYNQLRTNSQDVIEAYVLSGVKENALKVLKASREANAKIAYFNADLTGERGNSAIVDKEGKVYYGNIVDMIYSPIQSHHYFTLQEDEKIRERRLKGGWEQLVMTSPNPIFH